MIEPRHLARALGGEVYGAKALLVPGPGHSPRDRSLSIRLDPDAPDGFVVHSFAGDDPLGCRDYVRAALGLPAFGASTRVEQPRAPNRAAADRDPDREKTALALWRQCVQITGTPAETYLLGRGLTLDLGAFPDLRFHASLRFEGGAAPGMVALMRDLLTNEPCGVHRTFLDRDGRKRDRKMLGRAKGACVKLTADGSVTYGIGIAEGIETGLSVLQAGWAPVWACLSAGGIAAFPVLPGVDAITIFADRDDSGAGETAARRCCARWLASGREAVAITPNFVGDWNDAERGAA